VFFHPPSPYSTLFHRFQEVETSYDKDPISRRSASRVCDGQGCCRSSNLSSSTGRCQGDLCFLMDIIEPFPGVERHATTLPHWQQLRALPTEWGQRYSSYAYGASGLCVQTIRVALLSCALRSVGQNRKAELVWGDGGGLAGRMDRVTADVDTSIARPAPPRMNPDLYIPLPTARWRSHTLRRHNNPGKTASQRIYISSGPPLRAKQVTRKLKCSPETDVRRE
jgi:hypothetical protein